MAVKVPPATLLLSVPQMLDPNFMHTVVLLVEHSDDGAYGLVLNREPDFSVSDLFPHHELLSQSSFPVHPGGPVGTDTLQFVHRVPQVIPGGHEIVEGLYLGGEFDAMAEVLADSASGARLGLRLFQGYSGWGEGQLDGELALGSWVLSPPDPNVVFDAQARESAWREALRSLGDDGENLARQPPHPSWN